MGKSSVESLNILTQVRAAVKQNTLDSAVSLIGGQEQDMQVYLLSCLAEDLRLILDRTSTRALSLSFDHDPYLTLYLALGLKREFEEEKMIALDLEYSKLLSEALVIIEVMVNSLFLLT